MVLLWIRRDLRCFDNPALMDAVANGCRYALFISTPQQWDLHHEAPIKLDFIRRHLLQLEQQLFELGVKLVHLTSTDFSAQSELLIRFCREHHIHRVLANSEPEFNEQQRDRSLLSSGLDIEFYDCDVIAPRGRVLNQSGEMFKVFTPFKKAWLKHVREFGVECIGRPQGLSKPLSPPARDLIGELNSSSSLINSSSLSTSWPLADEVMEKVIPHFFSAKVCDYKERRDFPAIKGTSGLSPYLAIGALSPRTLYQQLLARYPQLIEDDNHPAFCWLNELIWRDFYKHLLFHYPRLSKQTSFLEKYAKTQWPGTQAEFDAWSKGETGYPLVDAAMRQLVRTGWMHNRLRMVVASFLTKHLLVDWRQGEQFFMSHLIDGDHSANNGGWQWAASTGCDAQPYFRVFNPILQSQKFDPNGDFIRKYLPELNDIPTKYIHFPHDYMAKHGVSDTYWPPVVEHKAARLRAIAFYKG
ncbi:deoxyribodipyrimidine photo-lyase [Shewanella woodyi]|uniref:Deoxyribodipyrimidine photo-lyase n=1 Tax=Shewanella woodyi (strain ATCC 51908 / MS32) TaxID=392500 RepID=B1KJ33_SHEWM|nr:deoxyribodipyrimidine photo-lyase [Shewanella woodyi]ACA87053.1 Deoxyribodipyrimidine photo-lyase [Shewanella woodyi ATCC 51908]